MTKPDKFVVIKIEHNDDTIYKVFASWVGGYLDGDAWKMNSGIVKVETEDRDHLVDFIGHSGSIYQCDKRSYGFCTSYHQGVYDNIQKQADQVGAILSVLPAETDWKSLL